MILVHFLAALACLFGYANSRQHFLVKPANQTVRQGETVVLHCTVGEQAQVGQTTWTKDEGVLGISTDYELIAYPNLRVIGNHANGEYHLEISNVSIEDDAEYECQVQPSRGGGGMDELRWLARVNVIVPPTRIELEISNKHKNARGGSSRLVEVRAGKKLDVNCKTMGGKPTPKIFWQKLTNAGLVQITDDTVSYKAPMHASNAQIQANQKFAVSGHAHMRMVVEPADNGTLFLCRAEHAALPVELQSNFTLNVIYPPSTPQIQGFDGRVLKSGERLTLICAVKNGNPDATLFWYRSGILIDRSYTIETARTVNECEFTVDSSDNEAEYRCEASNDALMAPLSTAIRLKVYYPPSSVVVSGPSEAKMGRTVEFSCESSASNPPAKISWNIDGRPYDELQQFRIRGLVSVSTVQVKLTKGMRKISIVCSAYNEHFLPLPKGRATVNHQFNVLYPPDSIVIYGYENKRPISVGSKIILTCVASGGNPKAEIIWYRGDKKVTEGLQDSSVSELNAQQPLRITVGKSDNALPYRCTAANSASEFPLEVVVKLLVYFPPDKLSVSQSPYRLTAGSLADFTCKTGPANPAPVINWRRGDAKAELLKSVDVYNTSSLYGGWEVKNRLRLTMGVEDNGAKFSCQAHSAAMNYTMSEDVVVSVFYKPQFNMASPQIINVLEKEPFALYAPAYANPPPSRYEWSKDGAPVGRLGASDAATISWLKKGSASGASIVDAPTPRSQLFVSGASLNVSRAGRRDGGEFKLTAINEEGQSTLIFQVYVSYAAFITHVTTPLYADPGSTVTLECHIDAFPKPDASMISWELPTAPRHRPDPSSGDPPLARRVRKTYVDGKLYLHISDVSEFDSGEFICTAYNGVGGRARKTALLLVKKPPKIRRDDPSRLKAAADHDAEVRLFCAASGVPQVSFVWLRQSDGVDMATVDGAASVMTRQTSPTGYESTLLIKRVTEADYGFYTCGAHNNLSSDALPIFLNYTGIPDPPSHFGSINVTSTGVLLKWLPGFDGGSDQKFRLDYSLADAPKSPKTIEIPGGLKSVQIENLLPKTKYAFQIESYNFHGSSEYNAKNRLIMETYDVPKHAQQSMDDEPILIIVLISFIGLVLLALNAMLIACFIKRHQRKKLIEKAFATRLSENGGANSRKILMYSSSSERVDDGSSSGGGVAAATSERQQRRRPTSSCYDDAIGGGGVGGRISDDEGFAVGATSIAGVNGSRSATIPRHNSRPVSGYSEDDRSVRTVIEVDQSGQPLLGNNRQMAFTSRGHAATYLLDNSCHSDYVDGNYIETMVSDGLQRRIPVNNNVYGTHLGFPSGANQARQLFNTAVTSTTGARVLGSSTQNPPPPYIGQMTVSGDDLNPPPAMGPLRSISQELNSYAPIYSHQRYLQQPSMINGLRRYSPSTSSQNPGFSTLVHSNGRTPYAEVRPILTGAIPQQNSQPNAQSSPYFSSNNNQHQIACKQQPGQGSPVLSTFSATTGGRVPQQKGNGKPASVVDYMDLDGLPGDLV